MCGVFSGVNVQVRAVHIISQTDSLLFGGYFNEVNEGQLQLAKNAPKVGHQWKTVHFEFSSPLFGYQANLEYSYRLKGFDENWSEWTKRTEKEYTNLPAGDFTFEVKARNNLGKASQIAAYSFTTLPPWYQSTWAIILYLLAVGAGLYFLYRRINLI